MSRLQPIGSAYFQDLMHQQKKGYNLITILLATTDRDATTPCFYAPTEKGGTNLTRTPILRLLSASTDTNASTPNYFYVCF